jgi:hypothetical protein
VSIPEPDKHIDCDMCLQEPATVGDRCQPCHDYVEWWNSLTPAQKRAEDQMMAEHVQRDIEGRQ